jgi:hypothetical protein
VALKNPLTFLWEGTNDSIFSIAGTGIAALTVDTVDDETHDWQNEVTNYPVETGSDITDNIRPKPDELSFKCFVSNAPIRGLIDEISSYVDRWLNGTKRLQECFNQLRNLRDSRQPCIVTTRYRTYENAAITGVHITRTNEVGEALEFTVSFRVVRIVSSQMTRVPDGMSGKPQDMTGSTAQRAQGTVNAGPSKGSVVTPSTSAPGANGRISILAARTK